MGDRRAKSQLDEESVEYVQSFVYVGAKKVTAIATKRNKKLKVAVRD